MAHAAGTYRKLRLMDPTAMTRAISRLAREIVETEGGTENLALVGIRTRGVPLAQRLAEEINRHEKVRVPVGVLDITLYRDDLTTISHSPVLKRTELSFGVQDRNIILCDDVLFTGRTVRAAIDAVLDFGRPRRIRLCVMVDRGRRELPIESQFVGKKISTSASEIVSVTFRETDGEDDVWLLDRDEVKKTRTAPATSTRSVKKASKKAAARKPTAPPRASKKA
ncbi:MAG: bifunctional pyr operon transcriptional regulator/uracil phosphoribosyltransferase PyrR [Acidobacteria bacterium]|nr:bifunctional pyr operon transcriptional regulator/uracil phosphoribosyltransferase PyrR [Acidobacteriota bacterium]MCG3194629.1 Bifunctional protein PyrR [Thermoanaerobaculia bacterium]